MSLAPGTRLGPYEIVSPLGAGGMGEVYKGIDTRLDRAVAIKVLPEHVASDAALKQRFDREAKIISSSTIRISVRCTTSLARTASTSWSCSTWKVKRSPTGWPEAPCRSIRHSVMRS